MKRLILYITLLFLVSCKAKQATTERFYSDTTIIKEIPKIVEIPGDTLISYSINIDSLAALLRAGVPPSVIERMTIREDPVTKNRVGILIDELGNLTAVCEIQEQLITLLEKEITNLKSTYEKTTIMVKPNFFQRIKASIDLIVYTTLILLAGLLIMKRFFP
jgi:hypothetical protein